jgi:hypothetical protein
MLQSPSYLIRITVFLSLHANLRRLRMDFKHSLTTLIRLSFIILQPNQGIVFTGRFTANNAAGRVAQGQVRFGRITGRFHVLRWLAAFLTSRDCHNRANSTMPGCLTPPLPIKVTAAIVRAIRGHIATTSDDNSPKAK